MEPNVPKPVRALRCDAERGRLVVRFTDGEAHLYVGVPAEVCRSFAHTTSKAAFYADQIGGRYPYNRLV